LRYLPTVLAAAAFLVVSCSSSSSNTCCISYNGANSYWNCPTTAAENACCGTGSSGIPGCISDPMDPAASGCTDNASPSDCP
jgi:hypothetical protein